MAMEYWNVNTGFEDKARELAQAGLSPLLALIMASRGCASPAEARELLRDGSPVSFQAGARGDRLVLVPDEPTNDPLEVRFAQNGWYRLNLYNGAEIPALPFTASC